MRERSQGGPKSDHHQRPPIKAEGVGDRGGNPFRGHRGPLLAPPSGLRTELGRHRGPGEIGEEVQKHHGRQPQAHCETTTKPTNYRGETIQLPWNHRGELYRFGVKTAQIAACLRPAKGSVWAPNGFTDCLEITRFGATMKGVSDQC